MTLSVACMECRENIRAENREALGQITIAHYFDNHHERYLEIPKTTDSRGVAEVLKDRSVITHPIVVNDG